MSTSPNQTTTAGEQSWTSKALLTWMTKAFADRTMDSPRLRAELLLSHVLGCTRMELYTQSERPAEPSERDTLRQLVARALKNEPVQYLVGKWPFMGIELKVDKRALIPRPCTETLVEHVLQHRRGVERAEREQADRAAEQAAVNTAATAGEPFEGTIEYTEEAAQQEASSFVGSADFGGSTASTRVQAPFTLLDLGAGTGCIPLAVLSAAPGARAVASDVSGEALALAQENAELLGLSDRIELRQGDMLNDGFGVLSKGQRFDVITSNPPYIPDDEWDAVEANVKDYEPTNALRGGTDGLMFVKPIIERAHEYLNTGGVLAIEIAAATAQHVLECTRSTGQYDNIQMLNDHEGLARVLVAVKKG